jgi:membrane protease YdiL (CAAX protease family)
LLYEPKRVRRWVWVIPIVFAVAILAGINYGGLADRGLGFTLVLLVVAMLIGFGEEGLFRCIGVTSLRRAGLSEGKVALWSSVIFGLAHLANIIGGDARALAQAIIVSFAGYFFYLIRRVSGSNILNSVLHGLFDFTILTGTAIIPPGGQGYPGAVLAVLVYVICGIIVLIRRHQIEPAPRAPEAARPAVPD